jgi:hypothetical protein
MSTNEDKHGAGERKGIPSVVANNNSSSLTGSSISGSSTSVVDLDQPTGDYSTFMGGSAAYGRTAFAQGGDQPAAFINFQDSETYRSVQVHNSGMYHLFRHIRLCYIAC